MKKLVVVLMVITLFVGFVAIPAFAGYVPSAKGQVYDINKDGVFNQADIDRFELCYGHKRGEVGWRCWVAFRYKVGMPYMVGDINCDGVVDNKDVTRLSKYVNWYKANGWWK